MSRVLVIGGTGMLGHKLVQVLGARMDTWATIREPHIPACAAAILDHERTIPEVRAERGADLERALDESGATTVVNAVGIVKQASSANDAVPMIRINALFPHELAAACAARGVRLIHVSTDCVFSGARGDYSEDDVPDAADLYGRSKLLGEVTGPGALTLRTSIVGRELRGALGLFEWFCSQAPGRASGYSRAVFSGMTTAAFASLVGDLIERQPELDGLWHASAAPIDKLTLLRELRDVLELEIELETDDRLIIDRSLDSSRLRAQIGWQPPSWTAMLSELAADPTPYEELRHSHA
jgi:dTDP-4-dehydrorhamnose reductase